ncbi:MAG TPA: hypothetical protein H9682_07565 [Firmicutes bacterium]|nr:hypothetical protein [Bacillota bacterium]
MNSKNQCCPSGRQPGKKSTVNILVYYKNPPHATNFSRFAEEMRKKRAAGADQRYRIGPHDGELRRSLGFCPAGPPEEQERRHVRAAFFAHFSAARA